MSTLFNKKILLQDADIIRYEDKEAHNTAERVGRMFVDIINAIDLSLGGTSSLTLTEVGNYLTNNHYLIKSAADGLYQPKGNYLTQHQSLSNYYTKPEIDTKITALNTAIGTKLDKSVFDDLFEKVQVNGQWVIRAKYGFYSNQFISALGLVQGDLGGGTGTGGSLFGLMRSWLSVDPGPSTQEALGANLGWELRGRIAALETAGYATQNWVLNKNYLTAHQDISHLLSKTEAASLYQPKGNYLTSHQSLAHLLSKTEAASLYQPKGNYLTGITKAMVEAVLTGTITTHNHDSRYYTEAEIDTKITALNTAIGAKLDQSVFDDLFEKVQVNGQWVIRAKYGFYSNQFISALGLVQGDLGGGTGTGGSLFGLMRSWPSVDPGPTTQEALGANLGWELRGRIAALETAGYATQNWVLNKNYLTAHQDISHLLSKTEAASLYQPKGNYLTSHQSLAHLLRIDGSNGTAAGTAALLNKLGVGDDNINDNMTFITSLSTPGANTAFFRRPMSYLWNYIKGKADAVYQPKGNYALASALGNYYTKTEINTKLTDGSVTKVGTATVGASNWPIYLNNGVPYACAWKFGNYNGAAAVNNGTLNENLNADKLDGFHADDIRKSVLAFKVFRGTPTAGGYDLNTLAPEGGLVSNYGSMSYWGNAPQNATYGIVLHLKGTDSLGGQLFADINHDSATDVTRSLWWRASGTVNSAKTWGKWHQIAFTDSNVDSATKLATPRTLWGQSFDGSANVSGNLTGVGIIKFSVGNEIAFANSRFCFGATNQSAVQGVNVGSLLVSNVWADYTKVPVNGIYIKGALRIGDISIEEDKANGGLKISGGVYATKYVSALGLATGNLSGGSSGGGTAYDRLDAWADYTTDKAGYVLSAGLGADLNSRVGANATSINSILSRLNSLEGGGTTSVTVTGSGNAITDISKGGTAIIATKGATFLTQHQSLDYIKVKDIRNTAPKPNGYESNRVTAWFNNSDKPVAGLSEWYSGINVTGWSSSNYAEWELAATATNHLSDNNLYFRVGLGATWETWQKILTSANYASILGSVYQAKGDYVTVAGTQTITGAKTFSGGLLIPYSAGTWISMAKRANQILGSVPNAGSSAHSLFTLLNSTGAAISYGGLGVNIGFYGFYKARMDSGANSYDWATTWDLDTGRLNHSGDLVARSFIRNGGTSSQFLMADGSTVSKVSASDISHTGWGGIATDDLRIPTMTFLALWNGAYNSNGASNLQYCYQGRFGDIVTQSLSGLDTLYVKKPGDTMTGILDIVTNGASLKLGAQNAAWMHIYSTLPIAFNCNLTNAGKQDSTLGIPDCRWSNVYATTINVTSTGLVSNLNADLLDGKHYSQMASGGHAQYTPAGPAAGRWIRIAKSNTIDNGSIYNAYAIISLTNSYYNTTTQGITFAVYIGYRSGETCTITQLGGYGGSLWPKARIVYPTAANTAYYIEVYYATTSILNEIGVEMTGSFNMELYDTYTAGEIPTGYAAKEQPLTVGMSAERFTSSVGTGTAPLTVASTTLVSNLNADMLDGLHSTAFSRADQIPAVDLNTVNGFGIMCNPADANATLDRHYPTQHAGTLFYGTGAYGSANQIYGAYSSNRWFARGGGSGVNNKTAWREFAFTDSNVASATKLQTARTLWGQSFDGSANVSGNMSGVGHILPASDDSYLIGSATNHFKWAYARGFFAGTGKYLLLGANNENHIYIGTNGNVNIGDIQSTSYRLNVNGTLRAGGLINASAGIQVGTTADIGWYIYNSRVCAGIGTARGVNVGSLLVSDLWADYTKVPVNGAYIKGQIWCGSLRIGDAIFSYDAAHNGIKLDKGLYSEGYLSALGLSELTNTKFTISAGYESDALTILNGGIYRSEYWGDEWNKGHGALNVAIHGSSASQQTPLLLAVKADTPKTGWDAPGARLFAMELLDNGEQMKFQMGGSTIATLHKTNGLMATTLSVQTIKLNGGGTLTYDSATGDLRINGKKILVATT
jgi:hypothetical protein